MITYVSLTISQKGDEYAIYFRILPAAETFAVSNKNHLEFCETTKQKEIIEFLKEQMESVVVVIKTDIIKSENLLIVRTPDEVSVESLHKQVTSLIVKEQKCPPFLAGFH